MQSSRDVDARTDVWALGVILYELLTGSPPFVAETMPALVLRVVHGGPPAPLRGIRPDVPPALELAIQGCLERDRQKRLQSVGELAGALAPVAPKRARISVERISGVLGVSGFTGASTALPPSSGNEAQPAASGTAASWGKTQAPRRHGVWLFAAAALFVLVAGGLVLRAGVDGSAADASVASAPNAPPAGAAPPVPESQLTPPPIVLPSPAPSPASPAALSAAAPAPAPSASTLAPGARRPSSKRSPTPTPSPTPARADTIARTAERAPAPPPPPPPPTPAKPNIFDDRK
jgi:serine/threonine-protein kinase